MRRFFQKFRLVAIFSAFTFAFGLVQPASATLTAETARIVDCLLPGKVKQLGLNRTYITQKRPTKTSSNDCAIRGGEYTRIDRADIETALSVWQGSAVLGDAEAQFYVGEIFEKGMGRDPDYNQAHRWYQQAADQGFAPALMSLGQMYESGRGVPKDLVKAMNYYRQASGLEGEEIEFASVFDQIRQDDLGRISFLETELEQERLTSEKLTQRILDLQSSLESSKINTSKLVQEIEQQKIELAESMFALNSQPTNEAQQLRQELEAAELELQSQHLLVATLNSELEFAAQGQNASDFFEAELLAAKSRLADQELLNQQKESQLVAAKARLENVLQTLESANSVQQLAVLEQQFKQEQAVLERDLLAARDDISRQNIRISELQSEVDKASKSNIQDSSKLISLDYSLQQAKHSLSMSQEAHKRESEQVESLKSQLLALQSNLTSAAISQGSDMAAIKQNLEEREQFYQLELSSLEGSLESKEQAVSLLQERLSEIQNGNQNKQRYLESLQVKLQTAQSNLVSTDQLIATKDKQLNSALATIENLNSQISNLPSPEHIVDLETAIAIKQQELDKERTTALKLNQTILDLQTEQQETKARLAKVAPQSGPVIAIRWPKQVTADNFIAEVSSGSLVNVVGAVYPAKTITEFKVNGRLEELDSNGMFLSPIEVSNTQVTVVFTATDDLGQTSSQKISIQPTNNEGFSFDKNGALTVPNIKFGKFYALVIGNDNYDQQKGWQSLKTASNDARAIAEVLSNKYDVDVTLKLNVTRDDMLIALEDMRKKLTENDNLIIYYGGHGYMDPENDQGYWIPVNGSTSSTINWVSNATITDQIRAMSARNVLVISDSCYSASLMRSGIVSLRSGLTQEKKMQRLNDDVNAITRMALSSGGLQPVADSIDNSGHSVFANALLKSLNKNQSILDGDSLATEVGLNVSVATQNNVRQVPRYAPLSKGGHQGGEFYFVPKG